MLQLKEVIKRIGQFIYFFTEMDTVFIDEKGKAIWSYGQNQLSEALQPYIKNISSLVQQDRTDKVENVLFHTTELKTYYLSADLYHQESIFLGTIIVGPFLFEEPTPSFVQDVLFDNHLPISLKHSITQYYLSLPLISKYKAEMIAEFLAYHSANIDKIKSFQAKIGKTAIQQQHMLDLLPPVITGQHDASVEDIEKRYALQNEFMSAVEHGDLAQAEKLLHEEIAFVANIPNRIPNDPLRSEKNLAFTFNTTLRIAVERGGLHPQYIHSLSEKFAIQIEKTTSIQQLANLQQVMLREYCEAVRNYSLKNYSFLIRKAIEYIRFHLEQELSLNIIAAAIQTSTYELSRKFKKETGQTLTDYINSLRIKEALYLMENRKFTITDIAYMVGFNDVNYFTKVFKKQKGMTPSAYRSQL